MSNTLELCEQYFKTRDVYKIFKLRKDASPKDIKSAYYKLSLQFHPDRVSEADKEEATEKFKLISKLYQVLSDKQRRTLYDEQGTIDDEIQDGEEAFMSPSDMWVHLIKSITLEDISLIAGILLIWALAFLFLNFIFGNNSEQNTRYNSKRKSRGNRPAESQHQ